MTEAEFRASVTARGGELIDVEWEANRVPPVHAHDWLATGLVLRGEFTLEANGVPTRYGVGDVFELGAGIPHRELSGPEGTKLVAGKL